MVVLEFCLMVIKNFLLECDCFGWCVVVLCCVGLCFVWVWLVVL